jgi:hypothetical protein
MKCRYTRWPIMVPLILTTLISQGAGAQTTTDADIADRDAPPFLYGAGPYNYRYGPGPAYSPGPGYGPGPGPGYADDFGYGPGPRYGRGPGYGPGPDFDRGYGYGPGPGYGRGYGDAPNFVPGPFRRWPDFSSPWGYGDRGMRQGFGGGPPGFGGGRR